MLSWMLLKANCRVLVIDKLNFSSSSYVAAGITNPITGRRFVKTWLADELIPFNKKIYRELEQVLGQSFYEPLEICKLFDSAKAQNDWSARSATAGYAHYLKNEHIVYLDKQKIKNDFGGFEIAGASRVQTEIFLSGYRQWLKEQHCLLEEDFLYSELRIEKASVSYKDVRAEKIIFCEGVHAVHNPFFHQLPFQPAKGECLIVEIPDLNTDQIIAEQVGLVPLPQPHLYYAGATHHWQFTNDLPSQKGKEELTSLLSAFVKTPYKIAEHKAAIRPTVKDRRPFIGFHPQHKQLAIFNGLGTKGISLAPYFASHFTEHLLNNTELNSEVDIQRFVS